MLRLSKSLALAIILFLVVYLSISAQPILTVLANNLGYGGQLFMSLRSDHTCRVIDLAGNTLYEYPVESACYDFKILDNSDWIYFDQTGYQWQQYAPFSDTIKTTYVISGSITDLHDIIVTDDYIWLMGREPYPVLSGTLVLTAQASTLQKQDLDGNILFDWHSQDHISLDEATVDLFAFSNPSFPHSNSFYEDIDGNLIVSFRNINSVIKICVTGNECQSGEIIWRFGGLKSDFAFVNDRGIAKQHSAIMTDKCHGVNRCLLLFDNGNDFEPPYSRAVEFVLDVEQGLVTKTWEYTAGGQVFARATGNVKRLENGDTVIGWGFAHFDNPEAPAVTVVDWQGNVKYEAKFTTDGEVSYRAHLYPEWRKIYFPIVAKGDKAPIIR